VKAGRLRGLTFAVGVLKRGGKFYGTDRERWWGVGMREIYRLRQAIDKKSFRSLPSSKSTRLAKRLSERTETLAPPA
jgi:hypothetical protein